MLISLIVRLVETSCRFAWPVVLGFLVLAGLAVEYARTHFAINTDSSQLISPNLPWRQREIALDRAFPQRKDLIVVVIDGSTPERADMAAASLARALEQRRERFTSVRRPDALPFFRQNGLLYLSRDEVIERTEALIRAQPFLGSIAADPSLRGLAGMLGFMARAEADTAELVRPLQALGDALETLLAGGNADLSWGEVATGKPPDPRELRRFIHVKPVLDFRALEPGRVATDAVRRAAAELALDPSTGVRVRLTGQVPMADEEFATVAEGAALNTTVTVLVVLLWAWLALHSGRIILAVFASLFTGLAITAAIGLAMVGALNLISVAFAVLFVGIGVDFGIQFCVRYRAERLAHDDLQRALGATARSVGVPLLLAAAATAAGFFSFLPTDYRGVSELGQIAGIGMMIAFVTSITMLPALMILLRPRGETAEIGYPWLKPLDRRLAQWRMPILVVTGLVVAAGLPLLTKVSFDFNPLHLRSAAVESVSTWLDLARDPATAGNTVEIIARSPADALDVAARVRGVPEVESARTLESFVPADQEPKLAIITDAAELLGPTLRPAETRPPPTDAETVRALVAAADGLAGVRGADDAFGQAAHRLATLLRRLAEATPQVRARVEAALLPGLQLLVERARTALEARPVSLDSLPPELVRDWRTEDGRARVEVMPRGDHNDNAVMRQVAHAVLAVVPEATGRPILLQQSADTVVAAFVQAGILAFVAVTLILFVTLRRISDVVYTMLPLVLAGVVTLELCVLLDLKLNFANIIALPLLLGVGVAFKIYYVLAWRAGQAYPLASSLTRAVFFSALTTATAFGSLWLSSHPGTSSMGKLLSLSLLTTLIAAVVFQPILMGPPRNPRETQ
jgi:hopanoid biosynthesis associated RND transporter like protein HpnN